MKFTDVDAVLLAAERKRRKLAPMTPEYEAVIDLIARVQVARLEIESIARELGVADAD
jgi:hypothetical protein